MVLDSIHCSFGQCVAASIVLGSVTLIAFLIKEGFSMEDKPLSWIIGFTLAVIFSWMFVGSVAWLYYECKRTRDKRRIRNAQTADPADEEVGLQEEVELEELSSEEACKQEEVKLEKEVVPPQELTHEEAGKQTEIEVKALIHEEVGRSSVKRRIRKSNLQVAGPSQEVDELEKIELEELAHGEVCKPKEIKLELPTHGEVGKHKNTKLYVEFWRSRMRKYNVQAAAAMIEKVSKQEKIELEELPHGEDFNQEEMKLEGSTHKGIRKQEKTKPDASVEKSVSRKVTRVRFAE